MTGQPTGYPSGAPGAPSAPAPPGSLGPNTRCAYHPDRLASSVCRSCNQPICTDCMVQAPVGWHCRHCVRQNAKTSPVVRYRPGRPGVPSLSQTPVTLGLIAICVAVYLVTSADQGFVDSDQSILDRFGVQGYLIQVEGQWYRLFTSIFLHVNITHIGLNMLSLYIIGRAIEPALGKWRYLGLFVVCGLGGSVAYYLLVNPLAAPASALGITQLSAPAVGASGAIFGLFGAYFVMARRAAANTSGIIFLIVINLVYGFAVPGIGWQAHVGGLATGLAITAGFGLARHRRGRQRAVIDGVVLATTCIVLGLLMLLPAGVAPT